MKIAPASVIERFALMPADLEQDEEDQRILEEIIVEGGEELAPEQRRETFGEEQMFGHLGNSVSAARGICFADSL